MDIQNEFPVNSIRVGDGIVLINIFTLDPDKAEQFVATQVGEYKRLKGQFPGSYTANLHISLDRTRAANYAHFASWLSMKYEIPAMQRSGGGAIVNTASQGALIGVANYGAYGAAKAGAIAISRVAAAEYSADRFSR